MSKNLPLETQITLAATAIVSLVEAQTAASTTDLTRLAVTHFHRIWTQCVQLAAGVLLFPQAMLHRHRLRRRNDLCRDASRPRTSSFRHIP